MIQRSVRLSAVPISTRRAIVVLVAPAGRLRGSMLRYRDRAKVLAGTCISAESM
ncbi:hypothetical protein [Nocardia sp. NPDC051463]|uniref:hypothetical protein n=1 Tax=Nocardia sp. NPDC051463 TaxID=3154845 RepID=UPI00344D6B61